MALTGDSRPSTLNSLRKTVSARAVFAAGRRPQSACQNSIRDRPRSECVVGNEKAPIKSVETFDYSLEPHSLSEAESFAQSEVERREIKARAVLRPIPTGRSLKLVSRLRSPPVTMLNGSAEAMHL